ncbi:hypothetical protein [Dyella sp.]|uniref:hypothetical protein n=1 Tax=Dyella sp. TaxID=1869338 RepID=UPI002ED49443
MKVSDTVSQAMAVSASGIGSLPMEQRTDATVISARSSEDHFQKKHASVARPSNAAPAVKTSMTLPAIPGLSGVTVHAVSGDQIIYHALLTGGQPILFGFDSYGNLIGGNKKQFIFHTAEKRYAKIPVEVLDVKTFARQIAASASSHDEAFTPRALFDEVIKHLQDPFYGIGDVATVLGFDPATAHGLERYADNPLGALLIDLNHKYDNRIGQALGLSEQAFAARADSAGRTAQGFIPVYGQIRAISAMTASLLKHEPLSRQELAGYVEVLGLSRPGAPLNESASTAPELSKTVPQKPSKSSSTTSITTAAIRDANGLYHFDDKQYIIYNDHAFQVRQSTVYPDTAYLLNSAGDSATGLMFKKNVNNQWNPYKPPRLKGGDRDPVAPMPTTSDDWSRVFSSGSDGMAAMDHFSQAALARQDALYQQMGYLDADVYPDNPGDDAASTASDELVHNQGAPSIELFSMDPDRWHNELLRDEYSADPQSEASEPDVADLYDTLGLLPVNQGVPLYGGSVGIASLSEHLSHGSIQPGDELINPEFMRFTEVPHRVRNYVGRLEGLGEHYRPDDTSVVFVLPKPMQARAISPFGDPNMGESVYRPGHRFKVTGISHQTVHIDGNAPQLKVVTLEEIPLDQPPAERRFNMRTGGPLNLDTLGGSISDNLKQKIFGHLLP